MCRSFYGFKVATDGKTLEPCPAEQATLQRMVTLRSEGYSLRKTAMVLNSEHQFNRYGNPWNNVLLHKICSNLEQRLVWILRLAVATNPRLINMIVLVDPTVCPMEANRRMGSPICCASMRYIKSGGLARAECGSTNGSAPTQTENNCLDTNTQILDHQTNVLILKK